MIRSPLHGYTSAQGAADVRRTLADDLNRRLEPTIRVTACI